ncbi:MAG TPA: MscL family protein [Candidatus Saccharimonadales bacterium]|nr:MscL family protein [Candidatus Saccharimonadales bacterium]
MADQKQTIVTETKDGAVKVVQPKGRRHHGVTVLLDSDDIVREQATGFANFLREYAVVGLAIGFIVGQQANAVAKQLVVSFIQPWVQVLFGTDWSKRTATLHHGAQPVLVPWGAFIYSLIEFFFIVAGIYLVVKLFRLDKLRKPKGGAKTKGKK